MVYRTSRYCTFSAESQSPTARAVSTANSTNAGSVSAAQVGATGCHPSSGPAAAITSKSTNATTKSTSPDSTDAIGTISRGK